MKQAKSKKKDTDQSSSTKDPLSAKVDDPLSLPPSSDPLSAALLDPLSQAAAEASSPGRSFGAKPEKVIMCGCVCICCVLLVLLCDLCMQ